MANEMDMNNMLSVLDRYALETTDDIALKLADDFRHRRIEKNLTREVIAERAGVAVSNIVRFEQKGLISLKNLIAIAVALGYTSERIQESQVFNDGGTDTDPKEYWQKEGL